MYKQKKKKYNEGKWGRSEEELRSWGHSPDRLTRERERQREQRETHKEF